MKILYDTQTCGRCSGSGSYSYNQIHGSVCYGCGGGKVVLTKAGNAARAAVEAKRDELYGKPARAVVAGDRVWLEAAFIRAKWYTVTESKGDTCNVGQNRHNLIVAGVVNFGTFADTTIRVWTAEAAAAVLEFARTLKGARVA